jgi:hypothetical protein
MLLKGMWFNSEPKYDRAPATLVADECGFNRIKVSHNLMKSNAVSDKPFVYPGDVEQIFFVEDRLHKGWQLVVPYDCRTKQVYYKRHTPLVNVVTNEDSDRKRAKFLFR